MEGYLRKWISYISGWQQKYCVVCNGELDIYPSKDAASKGTGAIASYQIALCEIFVDHKTNIGWELRMPNRPIVYLRTETEDERRSWLRTLGSVKACMMATTTLTYLKTPAAQCPPVQEHVAEVNKRKYSSDADSMSESLPEAELHNLSSQDESWKELNTENNDERANECSMQQETKRLDLICEKIKDEVNHIQQFTSSGVSSDDVHKRAKKLIHIFMQFTEVVSAITRYPLSIESSSADDIADDHESQSTTDSGIDTSGQGLSFTSNDPPTMEKPTVRTVFSSFEVSFGHVVREAEESFQSDLLCAIHTETYIAASISFTKFFDMFGGTLFAPLKSDILSNAEKVRKGYLKNQNRYTLLQYILEDEISRKQHKHPNSATQALLWMMRGLRTIAAFLRHSCTPVHAAYKNTPAALDAGYRAHLKPFHNYFIQQMFVMGIKLLPSFQNMMNQVCYGKEVESESDMEADVIRQILSYSQDISDTVGLMEKIYIRYGIPL